VRTARTGREGERIRLIVRPRWASERGVARRAEARPIGSSGPATHGCEPLDGRAPAAFGAVCGVARRSLGDRPAVPLTTLIGTTTSQP